MSLQELYLQFAVKKPYCKITPFFAYLENSLKNRKFVRSISLDKDELDIMLKREAETHVVQTTSREGSTNRSSNKKDKPKFDPANFEVPEFLYKFSSTFFKKASSKDKKIFRLFGRENLEQARIRSDRFNNPANNYSIDVRGNNYEREFQSEVRARPQSELEFNFEAGQGSGLKNFKRKDISSRNYKLKKDGTGGTEDQSTGRNNDHLSSAHGHKQVKAHIR